jgi:hypothetical protein
MSGIKPARSVSLQKQQPARIFSGVSEMKYKNIGADFMDNHAGKE